VVNAYLIAFAGLLLLAGRLGDMLGGKRFSSSAWPSSSWPRWSAGVGEPADADRGPVRPGAGGAMASAVSLGMIVRLFPEPPLRAQALGIYSFTGAGRRLGRPGPRRRIHSGAELALDLLRQRTCRRGRDPGRLAAAGHRIEDRAAGGQPRRGHRRRRPSGLG
jgi:hypothetical protein